MPHHDDLLGKIEGRTARVAVIGLGYVGLPLAVELARGGLPVTGIGIDPAKCEATNAGRSYIDDVPSADLPPLVQAGRLTSTTDWDALDACDAALICVPTPLNKTKAPDISYIVAATDCVFVHTAHQQVDWGCVSELARDRVVDSRGGLAQADRPPDTFAPGADA
jgi:UDP-N-acetyl-D-glucosamine dehydrogenase